jgi:hypothetical protein
MSTFLIGRRVACYLLGGKKPMRKWFWIAPLLAMAGWSQTQPGPIYAVPMAPPDGTEIPAGTELVVRVDQTLSTNQNERGDQFTATLAAPLGANGQVVLPVGTRLTGHVVLNKQAGAFKGWAQLMLALDSIEVTGRTYPLALTAASFEFGHKHRKLEDPDPNAGAAAGDRVEATVPAETLVSFTLGAPVHL